jgi:hypothetical protein
VVNASKHKDVTRGKPKVTSADKIVEHVVYTQYGDESGHYMPATKAIEITLKDGTTRELFDVLTNVVNMWMDFLAAAGISEKMKPFAHEDRNRIISRDEAGKMNLAMTQGIACDLRFKMQKYNYEKGFPEPWDLSGHNISFNVYDPTKMKTELTVQLTNPEGKKYVADIELDAEEKAEFYLLQGTSQEDEFKGKVIKRRGEVTLHSDQTDLPGPNSLILKYAEPSDSEKKLKPAKIKRGSRKRVLSRSLLCSRVSIAMPDGFTDVRKEAIRSDSSSPFPFRPPRLAGFPTLAVSAFLHWRDPERRFFRSSCAICCFWKHLNGSSFRPDRGLLLLA